MSQVIAQSGHESAQVPRFRCGSVPVLSLNGRYDLQLDAVTVRSQVTLYFSVMWPFVSHELQVISCDIDSQRNVYSQINI